MNAREPGRRPPERATRTADVILYNDDVHRFDQVALQIRRAARIGYRRAWRIMLEAHESGRALVFRGPVEACERVAATLRQIGLQVEICD